MFIIFFKKSFDKLFHKKLPSFSLMEVLIVIVILSTLALVVLPRLSGKTERARRTVALMDVEQGIAAALDEYEADNGRYPTTAQGLNALSVKPSSDLIPRNWNGPYLKKKQIKDPWGNSYIYVGPGVHNPDSYDLSSYARDGKSGGKGADKDVSNWE